MVVEQKAKLQQKETAPKRAEEKENGCTEVRNTEEVPAFMLDQK